MLRNFSMWQSLALTGMVSGALLSGCAAGESTDGEEAAVEMPSFENFFGGKDDTGYVGNRAAEIEATFTGRVRVELEGKTPAELEALATEIQAEPSSWEHREITSNVTEQLKYARNPLKAQKLNVNLEGGSPTYTDIEVIEGGLVLHYTVTVESLIKVKDLEDDGLSVEDLVGRVIEAELPMVPGGLFDRTGNKCTLDADTGDVVDLADVGDHNLFYYFAPDATDCPLEASELVTAKYEVHSSFGAPTVFPEYDLLTEDGQIDMVVIFGQITHGELKSNDWGFISFDSMTRSFRNQGFRIVKRLDDERGHSLEKTYPGGLRVVVNMFTPNNIADDVPRDESDAFFREQVKAHEIVYYNGHAFYGSLAVLDDKDVYPADVYQIINMDACWSYAYYTKQIFRNRATDDDPEGYALTDVVNNTEPGITGSEQTAVILYENLFKGASAHMAGGRASLYSWNNIIKYMNEHAEVRAERRRTLKDPEIYGVSGVSTNRYTPGGRIDEPAGENVFATRDFEAIPDNNRAGITSTIRVDDANLPSRLEQVRIKIDLDHTYIGDLRLVLEHDGVELVVHDRQGGGEADLDIDLETDAFAGKGPQGTWTLSVSDNEARDLGTLVGWSIEL